jgi:hypothetical protein
MAGPESGHPPPSDIEAQTGATVRLCGMDKGNFNSTSPFDDSCFVCGSVMNVVLTDAVP